jgi:glutamine synthetase
MAWMKSRSYLVFGDIFNPTDVNPYPFSPRNILKKKVSELANLNLSLKGASELEYFFYAKKYNENFNKGLSRMKEYGSHPEDYLLQQGDRFEHVYEKFRQKLKESGVGIETTKGEASIGQHEINIQHGETVLMSDTVLVLKSCMKAIADHFHTTVTFMAKPSKDRFGSSSHLHISLHNLQDGSNVFPGKDFNLNQDLACSNTMLHFLGGIMKYSLDTFIFFAPTINSYKRFKNFSWAPSNIDSWSVDNRTSPFRICGAGKSLRIEYRIPGGDINQYLAYSGLIAAGLEGIQNKIEPPKITEGNSYEKAQVKRPPVDLNEALDIFEKSEFITRSFGKDVQEHLTQFYRNEVERHEKAVTKWELNRYFDLI